MLLKEVLGSGRKKSLTLEVLDTVKLETLDEARIKKRNRGVDLNGATVMERLNSISQERQIPYRLDVLVSYGISPITALDNVPFSIVEKINFGIKLYNAYCAHSEYWVSCICI